jgi:predicted ATPase/GAF domain-containing protein/HPt (histidine-containing phosphotransfer) domain-containing protein
MTSLLGYVVTETLNESGELALYRGHHEDEQASSALMIGATVERPLPSSFLPLENEYALRDQLDIEFVVQPLTLLHSAGQSVLVLNDPGGEPLERSLGMPMDVRQFLHHAIQLTVILGRVHAKQLIHRDIKPAHILWNVETKQLWLTGFGMATLSQRERQVAEASESMTGTLAYMSPEQTGRMNRSVDSRSDLYSLGVLFYQMLTGVLPFTASDAMEWIHCHVARKPPRPTEQFSDIPEPLCDIVMKLLEKAAEQRYQSAYGLEADLRACLEQWEASECIEPFPLGSQDILDQLSIPEKLYGRKAESELLTALFEKSAGDGTSECIFVTGQAGSGKTALVKELQSLVSQANGIFSAGKFDHYKRDTPHTIVTQAFQSYLQQILYKSEKEVSNWRDALSAALGMNAQLMVDLLPELALIMGTQSPVSPMPTNEAKKRFQHTFLQLLNVFAQADHPFVLFLDDLQFIDSASLDLLDYVLTQAETHYFLFIAAYRDNELSAEHPLKLAIERLNKLDKKIHSLVLKPLSQTHIAHLLAETLSVQAEPAMQLSEAIHQKTEGNPFFTIQLLNELAEERLLAFNQSQRAWQWDIEAIRSKGFSDNVVEIMIGKLSKLPESSIEILKQIACFGNKVELSMLPLLIGRPIEEIHAELTEAVRAGFLVKATDHYKFSHDRIQEAAYTLVAEDQRALEHLRISRLMLTHSTEEAVESHLFSIVAQLNRGKEQISDPAEQALFRRLNFRTGRKAKSSTAYPAARNYFALAAEFVSDEVWQSEYAETLSLHLELLESEYLVGHFERADELSKLILTKAQNNLDRAKVYSLCMSLYQLTGKLEEAIKTGLEALKLFDIYFPDAEEELQQVFLKEREDVPVNINGRPIIELAEMPFVTDPTISTIINLLGEMLHSIAIVRPRSRLFPVVVIRIVNLSIIHGSVEKSCQGYQNFARMLIVESGDVATSNEFSKMVLRLKDRYNKIGVTGQILFYHGVFLHHWKDTIASSIPRLEEAFKACFQSGNYVFSGFSAYFLLTHLIAKGHALEELFQEAEKYLAFAKQIRNDVLYHAIQLYLQVASTLKESTAAEKEGEHQAMSEAARFEIIMNARFAPSIACHFILKQNIAFINEHYSEAKECGESALKMLAPGGVAFTSYFFYQALTAIALQRQGTPETLPETLQAMSVPLQKLKLMAESCPENFSNRYALVCAELADLEDRVMDAQQGYEQAIHSAREHGFLQNEALANELAGKFYLKRGFETSAYAYLREAHFCYQRWGASAKAKQLEHRYPRLIALLKSDQHAHKNSPSSENLDVMTIIKASQTLSGEIVLARVIERLMSIVLENAGAVRGLLILPAEEGYVLAAEATTGHQIDVILRDSPLSSSELPESIFQYVIRTKEQLLLDDAMSSDTFVSDDYIISTQAKSILFLPLIKQGKLVGVLYLENNLIPGAFTADRLTVLEMLISQAAISIENARLYRERELAEAELRQHRDHLEELVKERTAILNQKTNDIEAMLQNMDLGVCTIIPGNRIHPEYSQHLKTIFDTEELADQGIMEALFSKSTLGVDTKDQISVALDSIIGEDAMMYDFNSHLLVNEMEVSGKEDATKIIQMTWNAIINDEDVVEKVLFISQDVTQLRVLEQEAAHQKEELDIISKIIKVSTGKFNEFVTSAQKFIAENRALIESTASCDKEVIAALFRNMHTIKGNARTYDFSLVTNAAHVAEQYYDQLRTNQALELNPHQMLEELLAVEKAVERFVEVNEDKLGRKGRASDMLTGRGVFVDNDVVFNLKTMVGLLAKQDSHPDIRRLQKAINALDLIHLQRLVSGAMDSISSLVKELGKPMPSVEILNGEIAFSNQFAEALKGSFMHIVRNCLDHGIESPEERIQAGKPEQGTIQFACIYRGNQAELHIGDNGRGLALHKLYEKGVANGLISADEEPALDDVAELIFHSGLSTAQQVSDISGRGVGMDAVRSFLKAQGASIRIALNPSARTLGFVSFKFVITLPSSVYQREFLLGGAESKLKSGSAGKGGWENGVKTYES